MINPRTVALCPAMSALEDNALVLLEWYRAMGVDETLADRIYARHSYVFHEIHHDHRFVDVLSVANGRRIVDLTRFHDTVPLFQVTP